MTMTELELIALLLGKYVDKFKATDLITLIEDLPDEYKNSVYRLIKKYPPDADIATILQSSGQNNSGKKTTWTVDDLLDTDFPDPIWIVPDLIPVGLVALAGRPKVGKSWMALQLAIAVASGGRFLGKQVNKAEVLYLAFEDPSRRLRKRIDLYGIQRGTKITFKTEYRPLDGEGLDDLQAEVESGRYKLIVVDTFGRSLTAGKLEIKDYSDNVAVLSPLQTMAQDANVTMLLIDHHSKFHSDNPNPTLDLIGSIGKGGTFDTVIGLYKEQGKPGAKLLGVGREHDEFDLAIEFDPLTGCWQSLGDTRSVFQQNVLDAIKSLVKNGELATTKNIADHLDAHTGHVSRAIGALLSEQKIKKLSKVGVLQPYDAL